MFSEKFHEEKQKRAANIEAATITTTNLMMDLAKYFKQNLPKDKALIATEKVIYLTNNHIERLKEVHRAGWEEGYFWGMTANDPYDEDEVVTEK